MVADEFSFGRMLAYLRDDIRGLAQKELAARMCKDWEQRFATDPDPPQCPTANAMRTAISHAENNIRRLDGPKREVAAAVLQVPPLWFDNPAPNWPMFLKDLGDWLESQRANSVPRPISSPTVEVKVTPKFSPMLTALPAVHDRAVFKHKLQRLKDISQFVFGTSGPNVLLVSGPSGIGKSTLIHKWCQKEYNRIKDRGVLAIDCSSKGGESIANELAQYLHDSGIPQVSANLSEIIARHPFVLILDAIEGLRRDDISGDPLSATLAIEPILARAFRLSANLKIILTYAPGLNANQLQFLNEIKVMAGNARFTELELDGLQPEDAADFMQLSGLSSSREVLRQVAIELEGNPTLLSAFIATSKSGAELHDSQSDEPISARVQTLSLFGGRLMAGASTPSKQDLFQKLVMQLKEASPEAFLGVAALASSHDGLTDVEIRALLISLQKNSEFLAKAAIGELNSKKLSRLEFLGGPVSHLIQSNAHFRRSKRGAKLADDSTTRQYKKSFHALARIEIANILSKILPVVAQLELHSEMAQLQFSMLRPSTDPNYVPNSPDIERYHAALFHLIRIYDLTEVGPRLRRKNVENVTELSLEVAPARVALLDPAVFLDRVFKEVMMRKLGDEPRVIGRQLGHFERKLAMLSLFFESGSPASEGRLQPKQGLSPESLRALFLETAIVANYAGKLNIAHRAVANLIPLYAGTKFPKTTELRRTIDQSFNATDNAARRALRSLAGDVDSLTALLNVSATTYLREGHVEYALGLLDKRCDEVWMLFEVVADVLRNRERSLSAVQWSLKNYLSGMLLGFRRIAAKLGQARLYSGDLIGARAAFDRALEIEKFRSDVAKLRGETGRAYCRFLASAKEGEWQQKIASIIGDNLDHARNQKRSYEVIEWLIEQAHFESHYGDSSAARASLDEIGRLVDQEDIGLSYSAQKEIEIEEFRVRTLLGDPPSVQRLLASLESCRASSHVILTFEVLFMLANSAESINERTRWIREADELKRRATYRPQRDIS
ncbi:hypothetical protein XH99_28680 [Bradyrhizobium nanningense]|uniref:AAA+ ATPase domain-containing protein n=1 Tax=Bradyrhizobium nanningense TaxID=1325118 RepID=A0A4V1L1B5_9BRAD|nr:ATP-binding protein [Bradyrhizobium nanningense]RXH24070.1 hypothetical protein XH99_28680 [Bradyrhizobium nanningense]